METHMNAFLTFLTTLFSWQTVLAVFGSILSLVGVAGCQGAAAFTPEQVQTVGQLVDIASKAARDNDVTVTVTANAEGAPGFELYQGGRVTADFAISFSATANGSDEDPQPAKTEPPTEPE